MRHRARRDQERHHQHQRIEVVAEHAHEADAPDAGQDHADQGQQHPVQAAGIDNQNQQHHQDGVEEDLQDLLGVRINPSGQNRMSVGVDPDPGRTFLGTDLLQLIEHLAVVQLPLVQRAFDQRGFQIGRHQQPEHACARQHIALNCLELFRRIRRFAVGVVVSNRLDGAVRRQPDLPRVAMGQAGNEVVVDIGDVIELLRDAMDAIERLVGEDSALFHLERNDDDVGAAERIADGIVELDIGVLLRQQIGKIRKHAHRRDLGREEHRDAQNYRKHSLAVFEQEIAELGKYLAGIHACCPYAPVGSKMCSAPAIPPISNRPESSACSTRR